MGLQHKQHLWNHAEEHPRNCILIAWIIYNELCIRFLSIVGVGIGAGPLLSFYRGIISFSIFF